TPLVVGKKIHLTIKHLNSDTSGFRMLVHKFQNPGKCILFYHSIGIQQQNIPAPGFTYGLIIGFRESYIYFVVNKMYIGKFIMNQLCGAINRIVVDDKNFTFNVS